MSDSSPVFMDVPANTFVFREGERGSEMYIIESGTLDVIREARGEEPLATLGPGDFFGEMAILEDQPRFASVRSVTAARLLRVDRAAFAGLLRENFEIAVRIMRKLVARLRRTEEQLQAIQAQLDRVRRGAVPGAPAAGAEPAAEAQAGTVETAMPVVARASAPTRRNTPINPELLGKAAKLVHAESGAEFSLGIDHAELLVGRPDPVTGLVPEINLGPLDSQRSLSRRHAKIVNEGGMLFLREEVGTSNGTFVNGERLATGQARPLAVGDEVRFGAIVLRVEPMVAA